MATIGEVGAYEPDKSEANNTYQPPLKLVFGVFFDGTSNNMIQSEVAKRIKNNNKKKIAKNKLATNDFEVVVTDKIEGSFENGANVIPNGEKRKNDKTGYSNIAILHSIYNGKVTESDKQESNRFKEIIYNIYVEGPGTTFDRDDELAGPLGSICGQGNTGVTRLVQKAMDMVDMQMDALFQYDIANSEVHFHIYGFSRGATAARLFSYCITKNDGEACLGVPEKYRDKENKITFLQKFTNPKHEHNREKRTLNTNNITVDMLGLFDTVSSIGGISTESYQNNTIDYGLYSPTFERVKNVMHLCALDEFRSHFAITDIGSAVKKGPEIFLPGCHSDIGGGYIEKNKESFTVDVIDEDSGIKYIFNGGSSVNLFGCDFVDRKTLIPQNTITSRDTKFVLFESYLRDFASSGTIVSRRVNSVLKSITVTRKSEQGYSNTPLHLMRKYSETKCKGVFKSLPISFEEKKEVKDLLHIDSNQIFNPGSHVVYPGGSFTSKEYKQLRRYLHFSASNSIGFDMSIDKYVVRRYLYKGNKDEQGRSFVSSYNA
ncbi:MAG: DUF2235 domain-containing protein [Alistipes sp.]|nr:DUF2235 domain-containing protein [Alistipes sp.]